ncbi:hypothetical protein [Actinomadura macrotermitis]|uniref:Uncharacterized protein n=1 Tax=Actinomadura macrotermitis TaxID=2585200 RepID=A0A7K0C3S4_9ACTN|nr:hypothetical protein [Actinomadura macrotermitis]MQY08100.1 hypothetical protein [Actinomadura macrotermitis]
MADGTRHYRYVGPPDVAAQARPGRTGRAVGSPADLAAWLAERGDEAAEPFTFVIDLAGTLRLAPRRSEHVACAGGAPVLAAGEIAFTGEGAVAEVSNQSTGYCPGRSSWRAVRDALDRAGIAHPGRFTHPIVFRRCPRCRERSIVKDDHYVCVFCDAELPAARG